MAWITAADTLDELEAAEQRSNGDPSFIEYIDEVAPMCFVPGITTQSIYRRIA